MDEDWEYWREQFNSKSISNTQAQNNEFQKIKENEPSLWMPGLLELKKLNVAQEHPKYYFEPPLLMDAPTISTGKRRTKAAISTNIRFREMKLPKIIHSSHKRFPKIIFEQPLLCSWQSFYSHSLLLPRHVNLVTFKELEKFRCTEDHLKSLHLKRLETPFMSITIFKCHSRWDYLPKVEPLFPILRCSCQGKLLISNSPSKSMEEDLQFEYRSWKEPSFAFIEPKHGVKNDKNIKKQEALILAISTVSNGNINAFTSDATSDVEPTENIQRISKLQLVVNPSALGLCELFKLFNSRVKDLRVIERDIGSEQIPAISTCKDSCFIILDPHKSVPLDSNLTRIFKNVHIIIYSTYTAYIHYASFVSELNKRLIKQQLLVKALFPKSKVHLTSSWSTVYQLLINQESTNLQLEGEATAHERFLSLYKKMNPWEAAEFIESTK